MTTICLLMKYKNKLFIIFTILLILFSIHRLSYVVGVHDCSNMAIEQYEFFTKLGFDVNIFFGNIVKNDIKTGHAWISVNGYQYDCTSFLPQKIVIQFYNFTDIQEFDTLEEIISKSSYKNNYKTNYGAYNLFKTYNII